MSERIEPALLSEEVAAAYLAVGSTTLRNKRKAGRLPAGMVVRVSENRLAYVRWMLDRWIHLGLPLVWPAGEPRAA